MIQDAQHQLQGGDVPNPLHARVIQPHFALAPGVRRKLVEQEQISGFAVHIGFHRVEPDIPLGMILYPEPEGAVLAKLTLAARVGKGDARLLQNRRAAALHRPDIVLVCAQGNGGRRIQRIVVAGIRHFQAEREFADRFNISAFKVGIVDPDRGHFLLSRFHLAQKEAVLRHVAVDAVHAAHEHNVPV